MESICPTPAARYRVLSAASPAAHNTLHSCTHTLTHTHTALHWRRRLHAVAQYEFSSSFCVQLRVRGRHTSASGEGGRGKRRGSALVSVGLRLVCAKLNFTVVRPKSPTHSPTRFMRVSHAPKVSQRENVAAMCVCVCDCTGYPNVTLKPLHFYFICVCVSLQFGVSQIDIAIQKHSHARVGAEGQLFGLFDFVFRKNSQHGQFHIQHSHSHAWNM